MRSLPAILLLLVTAAPLPAGADSVAARIERGMFGDHRSEANAARNKYRHPVGTLTFFGLADGMTVLEIWPGAGWYTEVLAPVVRDHGKLLVAAYDVEVEGQPDYRYRLTRQLEDKFAARPDVYDQVELLPYSPPQSGSLALTGLLAVVVAAVAYSTVAYLWDGLKAGG